MTYSPVWLLLLLLIGCTVQPPERNNTANNLLRQGQLTDAVRLYHIAQVHAPDEPIPYYNLGVAHLEAADYRRAQAAFQQALRTADESLYPEIYFGLGEATFRQADYRGAIDAYRQVLLYRPDDADARYNLQLAIRSIPTETPTPTVTPTITVTDETQDITTTPTATTTPTPNNPNPQTLTPTPSPQANPENQPTQAATPDNGETDTTNDPPPMNEETALELLNDVQQGQGILYSPFSEVFSDNAPTEKDW